MKKAVIAAFVLMTLSVSAAVGAGATATTTATTATATATAASTTSPGITATAGPAPAASATPSIVPPAGEHPRLYVRASDIPELRARVESEWGQAIIKKLRKNSIERSPEENRKETDRGFRYYAKMRGLPSRAQLQALDYLLSRDTSVARTVITDVLDSLRHTHFGTKNDLSRASGIMIMVGATVYDWCYDCLTAEQKKAYIDEFIRIAGTMECGYPPKRTEPLAGHSCEWMLLRDLLSAAVAVYDEYPAMYNTLLELFDRDYRDVRNYTYRGGNYHQGVQYINVRLSNDMICQWILKRMSGQDYFDPALRTVPYDLIYRRRPDGQVLPAGDCNHTRRAETTFCLLSMLSGSYFHDPYLLYEARKPGGIDQHCLLLKLLWEDTATPAKSPEDLPLSRFSGSPFGWMTARTGWGNDAVLAEMKINEQYFGNHQHLDGGSFQIYYRGPLAIDSGYYQGKKKDGGYNSPNNKNYSKRTVAHNSLLVYDPGEVFECYNYGGADRTATAGNDGGQRLVGKGWDTCRSFEELMSEEFTVGRTLAHGFGPDSLKPEYTLLKGDITAAYSRRKVSKVERSFVFLNTMRGDVPAVMVIRDRVASKDASFRKTWLLHSIEEPEINGNEFTVRRTLDGDSGMLRCSILWPEKPSVSKIGGPGKEMWVGGVNYLGDLRHPDRAREYGQWRIEESPSTDALGDMFLNVIQVSDTKAEGALAVSRIESPDVAGAVVGDRAVVFAKGDSDFSGEFSFELPKTGVKEYRILITDLPEGEWTVKKGSRTILVRRPDKDSNALYFKGAGGKYRLSQKKL